MFGSKDNDLFFKDLEKAKRIEKSILQDIRQRDKQ